MVINTFLEENVTWAGNDPHPCRPKIMVTVAWLSSFFFYLEGRVSYNNSHLLYPDFNTQFSLNNNNLPHIFRYTSWKTFRSLPFDLLGKSYVAVHLHLILAEREVIAISLEAWWWFKQPGASRMVSRSCPGKNIKLSGSLDS